MTAGRRRTLATLGTVALLGVPATAAAAPKRIVALTPFTANTMAGLGVKPVAIGEQLGGEDRLSPLLRGVPRLTLSHPSGPNMEQLAQRNPQLVLSGPAWQRGHVTMRRLGIRVVQSEPRTVAAVVTQTRRIGALVGRPAAARRQARTLQRKIAVSTRGIRRRPTVLLILGVGRTPYAFLENSWGGDLIRRAGGRLLTRGLRAGDGYARISNETVVRRNPDIIIAVPHGARSSIDRIGRFLADNPAWRTTRAARTNRIYVSAGNTLLQPDVTAAGTIAGVRRSFLKNG